MGVTGLWKLIDAAGKPVPVETLENKVLAVDVSIWLHQLIKGFQDVGATGANAHLLGFFYRICKLLFFRIKPVFVFDGGVPALKRNTIAARQSNRSKASESIEKVRQELLQNLLKQHALGKILGQNVPIPKTATNKQDTMFFLPPAPSSTSKPEDQVQSTAWSSDEEMASLDEDSDSSYEEHSPRKRYGDIHSIDVNSEEFKALPADIRHDILSELKETRKQNSWAKVHLMPEDVGDFSSFQMDRLLKRRSVQVGLEEAEKEMGPRCFTVSEIQEILEYQGVDVAQQSLRIASDSTIRIIYANQKKEPDKEKLPGCKLETIVESGEELNSDIDDPLIDTLRANEDMSQDDILKIIREEESKKKVRELTACGNGSKNANELILEEIRSKQPANLGPGKNRPELTTVKKRITFDNKQVTKLLKDSAQKNLLPISKIDKVLEARRRKGLKRKVVRKVSAKGPNLSESSSDSDGPQKKNKIASDSSESEIDEPQNVAEEALIISNNSPDNGANGINVSNDLSASSDDDFEEVQPDNKNTSSSCDDFINVADNAETNNSKPSNKTIEEKTGKESISIELNFEKPDSGEEDIFADVFEKVDEKNNLKASPVLKKPSDPVKRNTISVELNLEKPPSDEEDIFADIFENPTLKEKDKIITKPSAKNEEIESVNNKNVCKSSGEVEFADVFEESKNESKTTDSINKMNTKIDDKETERAVILEELLLTKKKLEDEVNSSESNEPVTIERRFSSDEADELEDNKEEKLCETQESLNEKQYFSSDKLVLENDDKKNEKSPNSFAKKLATVEQVRQFQSTLERESSSLLKDKRRDEKIAATVSEQVTVDAQELLRLFGIPYLVAPMEAEAQCAFLDLHGLTQGTITDDSDIWLFGASNVYKNFFDQKKYVKLFKSSDIRKVYNLGRDELIMLGLLVGSDYTSGLTGVGPVTALEIVADFPESEEDLFPPRDRLERFASAFTEHKLSKRLSKKLFPVQLIEGFPSLEVVKAYTNPQVDESEEVFSWGSPNIELIREYAMNKFGWDANKTDKTMQPIIDKIKQRKTQMTLHGFFDWAFEDVQGKMSKRVEAAVSLLGSSPTKRPQEEEEQKEVTKDTQKKRAKRVLSEEMKSTRKRKPKTTKPEQGDDAGLSSVAELSSNAGPSSEANLSSDAGPSSTVAGPSTATEPSTSASLWADDSDYDNAMFGSVSHYFTMPEQSSSDPGIPDSSSKSTKKDSQLQMVATLPRVNATIQKLKKGQSLSAKPRTRVARESVSLFKPQSELNFDAPFGSGETRKRKKVQRTDDEKRREIEEARAKAARVIAKLKNIDQFHSNV